MPSNIEIKAKANNFERQKHLAETLSDSPAQLIAQDDTFYSIPQGRLKLRVVTNGSGELIHYRRDDSSGPKTSNYTVYSTNSPESLHAVLGSAFGVRGVVRKKRSLYRVGQTRIHLDEVDGLGRYIELEVVVQPGQTTEQCIQTAEELMQRLEISTSDLIDRAYIDLLTARQE